MKTLTAQYKHPNTNFQTMNREKAIKIYNELKSKCPGLILAGSVFRGRAENIHDLDLIWVGKIFPLHNLPIGDMEQGSVSMKNSNVLRFILYGEKVDIHRTTEGDLPTLKSRLSGHSIKM